MLKASHFLGYRNAYKNINISAGMCHTGKKVAMSAHCSFIPDFLDTCFYFCSPNGMEQTSKLHLTDTARHLYHTAISGVISDNDNSK